MDPFISTSYARGEKPFGLELESNPGPFASQATALTTRPCHLGQVSDYIYDDWATFLQNDDELVLFANSYERSQLPEFLTSVPINSFFSFVIEFKIMIYQKPLTYLVVSYQSFFY